jgi:dihydropteroate synthase
MKPVALEVFMVTDSGVSQSRRKRIVDGLKQNDGFPHIMGIINVTSDSFYEGSRSLSSEDAIERALAMWASGATWVDIGGESTRPGAARVDEESEIQRVVPVIKALRKANPEGLISIDTRHASVAREGLKAGADMVNDVSGLRDKAMIETVLEWEAAICIMHMQGEPGTMQTKPQYVNCVEEVSTYLANQRSQLIKQGHPKELICIDPGIGFGKEHVHNLSLLQAGKSIGEDASVSILWGVSRKRIVGHLTGHEHADDRLAGTLGLAAVAVARGINLLRVHDVQEHVDLFLAMKPFD